jgi:hypothetical protein
MSKHVVVAGVGMIPFKKPGQSDSYSVMGATATRLALEDAGLPYDRSSRPTSAMCTVTPPAARPRCTRSG